MSIKPIRTKKDYKEAMLRVDTLWDAKENSIEEDELDVITTLIEAYEEKNFPISKPNPIDAIKFRMDQVGLTDKDLTAFIGARSKVSEVLSKRRGLSLPMIRKLSHGLKIPAESLIQEYKLSPIKSIYLNSSKKEKMTVTSKTNKRLIKPKLKA